MCREDVRTQQQTRTIGVALSMLVKLETVNRMMKKISLVYQRQIGHFV